MENTAKQTWMIDWSSATGCGNDRYETPITWNRQRVISTWESAHYGCNVDRLTSSGAVENARYNQAVDELKGKGPVAMLDALFSGKLGAEREGK